MLVVAPPLQAQSRRLTGLEIGELLSGNTVVGEWEDEPYRQLYRADGTTLYTRQDGGRNEGLWRLAEEAYEESWDGGETWLAWTVRRVSGRFVFLGEDVPATSFAVERGDTTFTPE